MSTSGAAPVQGAPATARGEHLRERRAASLPAATAAAAALPPLVERGEVVKKVPLHALGGGGRDPCGGVPVAVAVVVGDGVAAARTQDGGAPCAARAVRRGVAPSAVAGAGAGAMCSGRKWLLGGRVAAEAPPRRERRRRRPWVLALEAEVRLAVRRLEAVGGSADGELHHEPVRQRGAP